MEETSFVSGITKTSEQSSLILSSDIPQSKPGPRETILAVIITHVSYDKPSNDFNYNSDNDYDNNHGNDDYVNKHGDDDYNHGDDDHDNNHGDDDHDNNHAEDDHDNGGTRPRAIICTVGETAISESMYPSDYCDYLFYTDVVARHGRIHAKRNYRTWILFKQVAARSSNMKFGISFSFERLTPTRLDEVVGILDSLRIAGIRHYGLLTVLTYQSDYSSTVSSMRDVIAKLKELQGSDPGAKTVLAFGPYKYSANFMHTIETAFSNAADTFMADIVIAITSTGWPYRTGIALVRCVIQNGILKAVEKTGQEALCKDTDFTGGPENYLGDPLYTYGVFSNESKVLILSEYNDSLATKFLKAVSDFGDLREDTAWLLYNVHNEGPNNDCPEPPFSVLKYFRAALKGTEEPVPPVTKLPFMWL
ncbi:hypothetical protein MTO96_019176 [Rhipicephalus appendiculatus]